MGLEAARLMGRNLALNLRGDCCRLARFGANLADAYSCFIFLPNDVFLLIENISCGQREDLVIGGVHTLSSDVLQDSCIHPDFGFIGWVASNHRPIHVSPFERDSRILGVYSEDQDLKSFIGIPIKFSMSRRSDDAPSGVLACDSKKAYAFSKAQTKLLEELAQEVSTLTSLYSNLLSEESKVTSWGSFVARTYELSKALGSHSVDIMRLKVRNYSEIEKALGTERAGNLFEQVLRLIQQTMPPHFPLFRSINGDIIIALDNMMSSFFENKFLALCDHVVVDGKKLKLQIIKKSATGSRLSFEHIVAETSEIVEASRGVCHEHRRA